MVEKGRRAYEDAGMILKATMNATPMSTVPGYADGTVTIMENKISFYVASCVPNGGVYRCALDVDGKVETKKVCCSNVINNRRSEQ